MNETTYIIVTRKHIYLIEGLYGPQYHHIKSFVMRLLCFLIDITINLGDNRYPKEGFVISQLFPINEKVWLEFTQTFSCCVLTFIS